jgi:transposase
MNKSTKEQPKKKISQLPIIHTYAAGIDVSDNEMAVALPINGYIEVVYFKCFTSDLHSLATLLKKHGIQTIAMESTGVYWVCLFEILQDQGFEVYLVNAKHVKNVTGRKSDESDAVWIQKLHSCGLLSASFQPKNQVRALRSVTRHRKNLVRTSSTYVNRIQKAMELMNIKLHTVISDIDGKTGKLIIEAIIEGERDAKTLSKLRDPGIKATEEDIIKSLEGNWQHEHLFELKQCYEMYQCHQKMIRECDGQIKKLLEGMIASKNDGELPKIQPSKKRKRQYKNRISFDMTAYLKELVGVDLTEITGISELSALTIISEIGTDMSRWPTEHHFTSWLGLAPNTKISGGKTISSRIMKKKQNAGETFRSSANSLYNSKEPLGKFYKRIKAKAGPGKATVATARKIAIIVYKMIQTQTPYKPEMLEKYQEQHKIHQIKQLKRRLELLEAA